jgi:hypothetical protein
MLRSSWYRFLLRLEGDAVSIFVAVFSRNFPPEKMIAENKSPLPWLAYETVWLFRVVCHQPRLERKHERTKKKCGPSLKQESLWKHAMMKKQSGGLPAGPSRFFWGWQL